MSVGIHRPRWTLQEYRYLRLSIGGWPQRAYFERATLAIGWSTWSCEAEFSEDSMRLSSSFEDIQASIFSFYRNKRNAAPRTSRSPRLLASRFTIRFNRYLSCVESRLIQRVTYMYCVALQHCARGMEPLLKFEKQATRNRSPENCSLYLLSSFLKLKTWYVLSRE